MSRTPPKLGELAAAAHTLETELAALELAVAEGGRMHLHNRGALERLARDITRAAEVHDRLQQSVRELGARLVDVQARTVRAGGSLVALGQDLSGRQEAYTAIVRAHDAILTEAAALTDLARQGPDAAEALRVGLHALAERARVLGEEARAAGFRDLAGEATGRHQQLLALAHKLGAGG